MGQEQASESRKMPRLFDCGITQVFICICRLQLCFSTSSLFTSQRQRGNSTSGSIGSVGRRLWFIRFLESQQRSLRGQGSFQTSSESTRAGLETGGAHLHIWRPAWAEESPAFDPNNRFLSMFLLPGSLWEASIF